MNKRFDYEFALNEYKKLYEYIAGKGFRCDASGSLRRQRSDVGDIDFVVEGSEEAVLEMISSYPQIKKNINRYEFMLKSGICIHAIPENRSRYIYTLWHSTGPKSHVRRIEETYAGKGVEIAEKNVSEEEIYRKIGLDYMKPEERYKLQEVGNDQERESKKNNKITER